MNNFRKLLSVMLFAVAIFWAALLPNGCTVFNSNPSGPADSAAPLSAGNAVSDSGPVFFKILLPDAAGSRAAAQQVLASVRASTDAAPTVTFRLTLINPAGSARAFQPSIPAPKLSCPREGASVSFQPVRVPVGHFGFSALRPKG